jgi:L-asparaginase
VIATGGTIAMKIDPVKNAPVPALSGEDLLAGVPGLAAIAQLRVASVFNIPSGEMDAERWVAIRNAVVAATARSDVTGVALHDAIKAAIAEGVVVVVSTRVPNGRVQPVYGNQHGGRTLEAAGAVLADDLSPQKARILLMLALQTAKPADIQALFDR